MVFSYLFMGMKKILDLKTPEISYLIGFIQTDGHLQKNTRNRGRLSIEISTKDYDILEKLQQIIPVNTTIYTRIRNTNFKNNVSSTTLNVFDHEFRNAIVAFGVPYGKKSDIISPPRLPYLENDYWRGIIDGDGSLGMTGKKIPYISLVTASEDLYQSYKHWLQKYNINIDVNRNLRDSVYNITLFREKAQKIISILYYDQCICLNRKLIAAHEAINWIRPKEMKIVPRQPKWTNSELKILKENNVSNCLILLPQRTINAIKLKKNRTKDDKRK